MDGSTCLRTGSSNDLRSTMIDLHVALYRLLFREPFGTAHGMRDGTDCVFVRLERDGIRGYGEATIPPYVNETQVSVLQALSSSRLQVALKAGEAALLQELEQPEWSVQSAARAAIQCAYNELVIKSKGVVWSSRHSGLRQGRAMVTIGLGDPRSYAERLAALPEGFEVLKVKLDGKQDEAILEQILLHDRRPMLLDANQGWQSVEHGLQILSLIRPERLVGLEQPFAKERWDLHQDLAARSGALIIADESIQGLDDLERAQGVFGGVNLKLMKCGGLDRAERMAERAGQLGLQVMLGSMSESSLGCAAMFTLSGSADLLDLDGPWLLINDPFGGFELEGGRFKVDVGSSGHGVAERDPALLDWIHIGA